MTKHSKEISLQVVLDVLSAYTAATRTAQVRLCHGLVPAVVELREATEQLDTLLDHGWVRSKRTAQALAHVHGIKTQIANCIGVIESRTAEVGYPLERQIANYLQTRADLSTLPAMEAAVAQISDADWDAWASALSDEPGDAAA